ncbi:MAG: VWA domain-containing protein [Nitrosomonadaceae bacterium]|nr:VWA domain-containing protein [Nitrosomonadaceae bacterium]
MKRRRRSEGFNLAFLDIMSCGLGAMVLVFILVKYDVSDSNAEANNLVAEVRLLESQQVRLQQTLDQLRNTSQTETEKIKKLKEKIVQIKQGLSKKESNLKNKKGELTALKNSIATRPIAHKDDLIEDDRGGEENYLIGLRVEGRRIVVLIDSSASMTDEKLLNIIRRKNSSTQNKKQGPKWLRTKKIVRWLLARTPKVSQLSVLAFNDSIHSLGKSKWVTVNTDGILKDFYEKLDSIVPTGATNLHKGLQAVSRLNATDLYIITDGLPTTGESNYAHLNPFSGCSSLLGNSKSISGECRVKLFRQTVKDASLADVKVNIILLPIEGDPSAVNEYWSWAASTGGLVISPAVTWP